MRLHYTVWMFSLAAGCSAGSPLAGPNGRLEAWDSGAPGSNVSGNSGNPGNPGSTGSDISAIGSQNQALEGLPCDVQQVVVTYCTACHGAKPIGPMSLVQYSDFTVPSPSMPSLTVAQASLDQMRQHVMPPGGAQPTTAEVDVFAAWVNGGLPKGACGTQTNADAGTAANNSNSDGGGGDAGAGSMLAGLPCEVSSLLSQFCISCHSTHPIGGAPMAMMTYADLMAPSPTDPSKTVAQLSVERMNSVTTPMPPAGARPDAAAIQAFASWVSSGAPDTGCATASDAGTITDPYNTPVVCSSGQYHIGEEGETMRPGEACISCHSRQREAPRYLTIAGTVYPTAHEPDDCVGTSAAPTIQITDSTGQVHRTTANSYGTFTFSEYIPAPYTAQVTYGGKTRSMSTPQTSGDCNSCHTESGSNNAPGRIMLP